MNLFAQTWHWLTDAASWTGSTGIFARLGEHLVITLGVVGIAALIALPIGVLIGHTGKGQGLIAAIAGAGRAIPTLGLLTLLGLFFGIGLTAPVIALVVLAIPPMLAGAYSGVANVDRGTVKAARGIGMSEAQIVSHVELPLAWPVILGGIRSAVIQVIATATLAAYIADEGLGRFIFSGLKTRAYEEMIGGALLVIALALVIDGLFALGARWRTRPAEQGVGTRS